MYKDIFKNRRAVSFYIIIFWFFILAVLTRISIVNEISDYDLIEDIIIETSVSDEQIKKQAASCEKQLATSDVIVTAVFTGNRRSAHYATLSTMTVTKVIKGDKKMTGRDINVYENNAVSANKSRLYLRNFTPVNLFDKGKEYLLFLNFGEEYDKAYASYKNITLDEFVMADYFASSFCTQSTDTQILNENSEENIVRYSEFKKSEFIVFSENQKAAMYDLKAKVLKAYLP